ncbi:MAG: GntR family transcriptional regulator [Thermodesulfobacteriota bacterium]|jgi:DNA-binding GntR family transcriptional regulator
MDLSVVKREFTPRYSVPLPEQIAEFVTNAIIERRIESGQQLVENELQRKFCIGRAPIRESFRILET